MDLVWLVPVALVLVLWAMAFLRRKKKPQKQNYTDFHEAYNPVRGHYVGFATYHGRYVTQQELDFIAEFGSRDVMPEDSEFVGIFDTPLSERLSRMNIGM